MGSVATLFAGLIVGAVLAPWSSGQTTWNVPGDSATIQGAIDLAVDGDTVLVAPGTYAEVLDVTGKALTLESSGGAQLTVIDGQGVGPVVTVDRGVLLRGFTVTGGDTTGHGGGLHQLPFLPVPLSVEGCRFSGNHADGDGGGAYTASAASFTRCVFDDNEAGGDGGGAYSRGDFLDCVFRGNRATDLGGGLSGSLAGDLTGTLFERNVAASGGGAGFDLFTPTVSVSDCTFVGNRALAGHGGGLFLNVLYKVEGFGQVIVTLTGIVWEENQATGDGGGAWLKAANLGPLGAQLHVRESLVARNVTGGDGGGLLLESANSTATVWNGTVVDNVAGGSISGVSGARSVRNSIVWGNDTDSPSIRYSDVEGGAAGTGNIDADPLFVDPGADAWCLTSLSPCIDAGDPALTDPDDTTLDMGFRPRSTWCDAGNALGSTNGIPHLSGDGPLTPGSTTTITLTDGWPSGSAGLVIGVSPLMFPFESGIMVPSLDFLVLGLPLDADGGIAFGGAWPAGVPSGFTVYLQMWMEDPNGFYGFTATNGLLANTD